MKWERIISMMFMLSLFAEAARAQDMPSSESPVIHLDDIVVTGSSRPLPGRFESRASDTVRPGLSGGASPGQHVDALVGQVTGVHLRRYGLFSDTSDVSIRGSTAAQVQVFLDGVPLDSASGSGLSLSLIPVASLSRIDIFKSFAPVEFGGSAVGGLISLHSRAVDEGTHQRYKLSYGSFNTLTALAEISRGKSGNGFTLGMDFENSDGDFSFLDDNGTPLNTSDDTRTARRNNALRSLHPFFRWQHSLDARTRLTLATHFFRLDRGVPGFSTFQSQNAAKSLTEWLSQLTLERTQLHQGKSSWRDVVYARVIKSQFSDPNGEIGLGATQDNDDDTLILGNRFLWSTDFSKNWQGRAGAEWTFEWFRPEDFAAVLAQGTPSTRHTLTFSIEPELRWWQDRLILSPQGRGIFAFYNINNDDPSLATRATFFSNKTEKQFSGRLALRLILPQNVTLRASGGRMVRLPKFNELFGDQGTVLGNAQLQSETAWQMDAGARWQKDFASGFLKQLTADAGYFETHTDNLIQFEQTGGLARAGNIGAAVVRGLEVYGSVHFLRRFTFTNQYTFQRASDRSTGRRLIGRAEHELNSTLKFSHKSLDVSTRVNFLDGQYLDSLNTLRVDHRLIWDAQISYGFFKHYRAGVSAQNLSGSQVVDALGFPLPGRAFYGSVSAEF